MPLATEKQKLLLDSCISEYLLDTDLHEVISTQLSMWAGEAFELAISEVSYAELVNGAFKSKIDRVKKQLDSYTRFEVSKRVLVGSGVLANIYKAQNPKTNGASFQDMILAATSIIFNVPLVTANVVDFPHPFFTSVATENLTYSKKSKPRYLTIDILVPNRKLIRYWYTQTK